MDPGVALWVRSQLRARGRPLVLLGVAAGLAGAVALTALAGAARGATSIDRLFAELRVADAGLEVYSEDNDAEAVIGALPEVEAVSIFDYGAFQPAGIGLTAGLDTVGIVPGTDGTFRALDRLDFASGRLPEAVDEVVIDAGLARLAGVGVGDTLPVDTYTGAGAEALFTGDDDAAPDGTTYEMTVTGIATNAEGVLQGANDEDVGGVLVLSRAFATEVGVFPITGDETAPAVFVREVRADLAPGVDLARFNALVDDAYGGEAEINPSEDSRIVREDHEDRIAVETTGMRVFGLVAAVASAVAVGHVLARTVGAAVADAPVLAVIGLTRRRRIAALVLLSVPTTLVALVVMLAGAAAGSTIMPVGLAGRADPSLGFDIDVPLFVAAAAVVAILIPLRTALAVFRATRPAAASTKAPAAAPIARRAPTPAARVGVGLALGSGRSAGIPNRSVIAGAVVGVGGVVAAVVFASSLDHLLDDPALVGETYDAVIHLYVSADEVDEARDSLAADPRIDGVVIWNERAAQTTDGETYRLEALDTTAGSHVPVMVAGRPPVGRNEIALSAKMPGRVGDRLTLRGTGGDEREVEVVGIRAGDVWGLASADVLTFLDPGDGGGEDVTSQAGAYVRFAEGVDRAALVSDLTDEYFEVYPTGGQAAVLRLERARTVPWLTAAFVAVLAASAVTHGLVLTVRRRRRDLAVLRVLGFRPRQVRAVVGWQTATISVVAVSVGVLLGLGLGRLVWTPVAEGVFAVVRVDAPGAALVLVAAAAVVGSQVSTLWPRYRAGRIKPSTVLRAE